MKFAVYAAQLEEGFHSYLKIEMKGEFMRKVLTGFIALGALVASYAAMAQTNYPAKPVEMVVSWPAGGGTDVVARVFAEAAKNHFSQPIMVVNKPGAIGTIGLADVANSRPDGYKVLMATPEVLIAPLLGMGHASIDNFVAIARINADPSAITVRTDSPWKTIEEFMAYAKANPGKVTLSTSGNGAIPDVAAMAIEEKTGVKFTRIPYQGEAPAIQAALAGQVDATVVAPGALSQHVKAEKLRVLAVTSAQRVSEFSNVPTFKEKGVDVGIGTWRGLLMPKGTPVDVINSWRELARKVNSEQKFQDSLKRQNINVIFEDSEAFASVLKDNQDTFKRLIPKIKAGNN